MHALHAELDPTIDADADADAEWDLDIELAMADDLELPAGGWEPADDAEDDFDLDEIIARAYEKLADFPRYQVHVELVDANAIP